MEGDNPESGDPDWRWWMGCQPHIRALRETVHSAPANSNREVEYRLQKCVSLYMAEIRRTSTLMEDEKKMCIAVTGGRITAMESLFMWLGGWRPTAALLLVYSLMGVQLEDEIRNFGFGVRNLSQTSAVLSHHQLTNLTKVQKSTRDVERKLSKKLAHIQMLVSDQDVLAVALRCSATTMQVDSSSSSSTSSTRASYSSSSASTSSACNELRDVLRPRMSRIKKLVLQADQLRLHTVHQLFLVLTPVQVARCAIAAFELAFVMRELGKGSQVPPEPQTPYSDHVTQPGSSTQIKISLTT